MTSSPSWITVAPSAPAVGIIERRAARLPGARPGKPDITPGEYSNGAFGENHSDNDTALPNRQSRRGAVEHLDLRLLVDRRHQRMLGCRYRARPHSAPWRQTSG